ncbi:hypothetical protein E2C01_081859 [Portunus trituberculatus]|uniref:Uncharacterized protein n=1 Tax=Portunus trituberculatus TaxID=210409 RepID=A0A5B7ING6_PORTR|nr:hypothetical protein [Portunus trituberculatus]
MPAIVRPAMTSWNIRALIGQNRLPAKINSAIAFSAMARLFRPQLGTIAEG